MIFVYILIIFVFLLKKYLDKQSEYRPVNHYLEENYNIRRYDLYCNEYFDDLIQCLIFCTYNAEKFRSVPDEIVSIRSLRDDLDDVFDKDRFESLFRNELIEENLRTKLLFLKEAASTITDNEWLLEDIDLNSDERWKTISRTADELLTEMGIEQRTNNIEY